MFATIAMIVEVHFFSGLSDISNKKIDMFKDLCCIFVNLQKKEKNS
jgi:hypothetical protein